MNTFTQLPAPFVRHALLLVALACSLAGSRAAEFSLKPVFPDITPVCSCESLMNVVLPNTTIDSAIVDTTNQLCRVTAIVTHPPAGDRVTVWIGLPLTNWNGRFQGTGGGGFLGGHPNSLRGPVAQGFSAGATDTGHMGGSGSFALDANGRQDWQAIINNAYLGIHEMTVVGKALTQAYYGQAPRHSYFVGGSTGGRQGLMEAQRYPDDYDGILSACPAINWHRFVPASLWPQVLMRSMSNFVSKAKLDAATAAAVSACDPVDGVTDGAIDDPLGCAFDPGALVGTQVGDETFTTSDADVIRKIWEGPRREDGSFMWYGLERGADMFPYAGTRGSPLEGRPFGIALDYWVYYLAQDAKWDWTTLTHAGFEQLWTKSVEQFGAVIGTDDPDLTRFRDHGGKVLIYHGLTDQLIPATGTIDYFRRVQQQMGGPEKTAEFARLFLVPGVDHGFRGAGPTPVGQLEALIRWVEEGRAPEELRAEKRDSSGKVIQARTLLPYPQNATHNDGERSAAAQVEPPASPEVTAAMQPYLDSYKLAGVVSVIADKTGKVHFKNLLGDADVEAKRPIREDNVFWIASMTKMFAGASIMMLLDEGKVSLDDPVTKFIPQLANWMVVGEKNTNQMMLKPLARPVTVRHVLSHTSGLTGSSELQRVTGSDGTPLKARALSSVTGPLQWQPGDKYQYGNQGMNIAARIVEIVSGLAYEEFLQERFFDPLGMTETTFWPGEAQIARLAGAYGPNKEKNGYARGGIGFLKKPYSDRGHRYPEAGGGLFSTTHDILRYGLLLANNGELDGRRYLSPAAMDELRKEQTGATKVNYSLGYHLRNGMFGHDGALGTDLSVNPVTGMVAVFMIQCTSGDQWAARDLFLQTATEVFQKVVQ